VRWLDLRALGWAAQRNYLTSPTMTTAVLAALAPAQDPSWISDYYTYMSRKGTVHQSVCTDRRTDGAEAGVRGQERSEAACCGRRL
jgi:hypothetical protein